MKQKLLFLLALGCLIGANAQTKKVQTETKTINILNNDCKETTSYYYDDEDHKILHGNYSLRCNTKQGTYSFVRNETVKFVDGEPDGPYNYNYDLNNKRTVALQMRWGAYQNFVSQDITHDKTTGKFVMGKADGVWTFSHVNKSTLGNETTDNTSMKLTITFDKGKVVGVKYPDGDQYTFEYYVDSTSGDTLILGNTTKGSQVVKNSIFVSHMYRMNGDISPIDDPELVALLKKTKVPSQNFEELLEKNVVLGKIDRIDGEEFPTSTGIYSFVNYIGDKANNIFKQAVLGDIKYYIAYRVKVLSDDDALHCVDSIFDLNKQGRIRDLSEWLECVLVNQRNPFKRNQYFKASTIEKIKPHVDELLAQLRAEEEARQAELKRKEEERQVELKRKEEARLAELKRQEEERKRLEEERKEMLRKEEEARQQAEKEYNEYAERVKQIQEYHDFYGEKLYTNYKKGMIYIPHEGMLMRVAYLKSGQTYWNIAFDELKVRNHIRAKSQRDATKEDYDNAKQLIDFYKLFYYYCCEATMVDSMEHNAKSIKEMCTKPVKDVNDAYRKVYSDIKISKSFDSYKKLLSYAQTIYDHVKLQNKCKEFIALRNEMAQYDASIMDSKAKYIKKLYEEYYENVDKAWTPEATVEKLTPIIETMKKVLSIVRRDDIKDFDKQIKKAKISTLEEVIRMSE